MQITIMKCCTSSTSDLHFQRPIDPADIPTYAPFATFRLYCDPVTVPVKPVVQEETLSV
ncbi:MAG: hypothetical protein K2Y01_07155 [Rhabdochlamydiaceae bacterium]|nr:hypothetical protein [Rhabdochlamydiaceae bacterium]